MTLEEIEQPKRGVCSECLREYPLSNPAHFAVRMHPRLENPDPKSKDYLCPGSGKPPREEKKP